MNATNVDFEREVIERSARVPVLVDFWAPWCGPCKMLGPVIQRLAEGAGGRWELVKVNTDERPDLAGRYGIRSIPSLKLFHRGAVVAEMAGALPEPQLRAWIEQSLPTPKRETMARARELLRAGRAPAADALLRPLAESERGDAELVALAARARVFQAPDEALAMVVALGAGGPWDEQIELVRSLGAALSRAREGAPGLAESPLRDRYLAALEALRNERFDEALRGLVSVLEEQPGFDAGRAKAACLAVFRHLGLRHPLSDAHLGAYSRAVNV